MSVFKRKYKGQDGKDKTAGKWSLDFRDHEGIVRRVAAFTDKAASLELERHLKRLVSLRMSGSGPDAELARFLETCPDSLLDKLVEWNILKAERAAGGKALLTLAEGWGKHLLARQCAENHCRESMAAILKFNLETGAALWSEVTPAKVENWLAGLREAGASNRTSNAYLSKMKAFAN